MGQLLFKNDIYVVQKANPTGGKAGTGYNKTSTIQVIYKGCQMKHIRYTVGDQKSYEAAIQKARKYTGING